MPEQTVVAADEQVVVFEVDAESYGVAISAVQEIIRTPVITIVPRAPEHVAGVINLRGRVIPVIDLRIRFRLPPREAGRDSRVVVMDVDGQTVGASPPRRSKRPGQRSRARQRICVRSPRSTTG
jgi:purine-binding chemotaxis protein CheW